MANDTDVVDRRPGGGLLSATVKELTLTIDEATGETATAVYLPHEERAFLDHIAAGEKNGTPRVVLEREVRFMHALKATFGAVLLP